jgi:hypothetical protein
VPARAAGGKRAARADRDANAAASAPSAPQAWAAVEFRRQVLHRVAVMSATAAVHERRLASAAVLVLLLLPLGWLWPCAFSGQTFVPFDLAAAPPAGQQLDATALAAARADSNFDVTETMIWFLPELARARSSLLTERAFPSWNPDARGGAPMHGHGEDGLLYPPNWLLLFAGEPAHWLWLTCWLSLAVAGLSTFGLLRAVQLSPPSALFGAITFQLSGTLAANAHFCWRTASLVWLPAILWALLAMRQQQGRARLLPGSGFALAVGATWLGGFPVYASANCLLAAALGLVLALRSWGEHGRREGLHLLLAMAISAAAGVCLALPQVLPSMLFFAVSARDTAPSVAQLGTLACDPAGLLGYLVPDLFGRPDLAAVLPLGDQPRSPLWLLLSQPYASDGKMLPRYYNATEYSVFAGSLGLLLALRGIFGGSGAMRRTAVIALLAILLLALFVPGVRLLGALPVVNHVHPFRWLAPGSLFVAWLAAAGCERLRLDAGVPWRLLVLALLAACGCGLLALWFGGDAPFAGLDTPARLGARFHVPAADAAAYVNDGGDRFAAGAALAHAQFLRSALWLSAAAALLLVAGRLPLPVRTRWLPWSCCALAAVELLLHGHVYAHGRDLAGTGVTPVHEYLQREQAAAAAQGGIAVARASTVARLPDQLPPGMLLTASVRDMHFDTHYDAHSHQPWLRLYGDSMAATGHLTQSLPDDERLQHPLLDLFGITHLLSTDALVHAGERTFALPGRSGSFFVYRRPHALPRAFVVGELQVLADDAAVLAAMVPLDDQQQPRTGIGWQPGRTALATAADAQLLPPRQLDPLANARAVTFTLDHASEVEVDVAAGAAGLLVLSDTFLPGWRAEIDGQAAPMTRVDHALRGVAIPDRACRVHFVYCAPGLWPGLAFGAAGILLTVALAVIGWRARRATAV